MGQKLPIASFDKMWRKRKGYGLLKSWYKKHKEEYVKSYSSETLHGGGTMVKKIEKLEPIYSRCDLTKLALGSSETDGNNVP